MRCCLPALQQSFACESLHGSLVILRSFASANYPASPVILRPFASGNLPKSPAVLRPFACGFTSLCPRFYVPLPVVLRPFASTRQFVRQRRPKATFFANDLQGILASAILYV